MDWISTACGDKWNINEILKICQECRPNEHSADRQCQSLTQHLRIVSDRIQRHQMRSQEFLGGPPRPVNQGDKLMIARCYVVVFG